jgi:hypothetical protein
MMMKGRPYSSNASDIAAGDQRGPPGTPGKLEQRLTEGLGRAEGGVWGRRAGCRCARCDRRPPAVAPLWASRAQSRLPALGPRQKGGPGRRVKGAAVPAAAAGEDAASGSATDPRARPGALRRGSSAEATTRSIALGPLPVGTQRPASPRFALCLLSARTRPPGSQHGPLRQGLGGRMTTRGSPTAAPSMWR